MQGWLCVTKPILENNYSVTTAQFSFWLDTHYFRFSFINSFPSFFPFAVDLVHMYTDVCYCSCWTGVYIKRHWSINTYLVNHHHDAQRWAVISFIEEFSCSFVHYKELLFISLRLNVPSSYKIFVFLTHFEECKNLFSILSRYYYPTQFPLMIFGLLNHVELSLTLYDNHPVIIFGI